MAKLKAQSKQQLLALANKKTTAQKAAEAKEGFMHANLFALRMAHVNMQDEPRSLFFYMKSWCVVHLIYKKVLYSILHVIYNSIYINLCGTGVLGHPLM